jgi:hypothetical protein
VGKRAAHNFKKTINPVARLPTMPSNRVMLTHIKINALKGYVHRVEQTEDIKWQALQNV